MATVIPNSPPSPAHHNVESFEVPFDYPDADIVLRSRDSHTFRVLKLYIIKSSSVLGGLIKATSDTSVADNSAGGQTHLPEVQLYENSAILSCLLTFIFPVTPILPSTLEETMELLSVAKKYEMSSVLTHIRNSLSRRHLLFIRPENAFLAYSLAQNYRLLEEATQAARLTLKFVLTIETLEDKLAVMPGAYLHELWKYHQRVQAELRSALPSSGAGVELKGFNCSQYATNNGNPQWIELYIWSIIQSPSHFDPTEFQMALARHTAGSNGTPWCVSCINIPVETMRTFWTNLTATVHRSMEKAESELSILGTETNPRHHMGLPVVSLPLPECLDSSEADVVVRTSDQTSFLVHKSVLASSSWVFRDMFTLPWPPNNEMIDGLPVIDISEDAELVRSLITILYPIPSDIPASHDRTLALLATAQKYDMGAVQTSIRAEVIRRSPPALKGTQAFRAYAIANRSGLTPEMDMAARRTLDQPMTFEHLGPELQFFEGRALSELSHFRKACRDNLVLRFKSFLDIDSGFSKIWVGCPTTELPPTKAPIVIRTLAQNGRPKSLPGPPTLPTWIHNFFTSRIEELKQAYTCPLIKSSAIREKYLEALRTHAAPDRCTFCLGVHAMKGEWYCTKLEQALSHAREKTPHISD